MNHPRLARDPLSNTYHLVGLDGDHDSYRIVSTPATEAFKNIAVWTNHEDINPLSPLSKVTTKDLVTINTPLDAENEIPLPDSTSWSQCDTTKPFAVTRIPAIIPLFAGQPITEGPLQDNAVWDSIIIHHEIANIWASAVYDNRLVSATHLNHPELSPPTMITDLDHSSHTFPTTFNPIRGNSSVKTDYLQAFGHLLQKAIPPAIAPPLTPMTPTIASTITPMSSTTAISSWAKTSSDIATWVSCICATGTYDSQGKLLSLTPNSLDPDFSTLLNKSSNQSDLNRSQRHRILNLYKSLPKESFHFAARAINQPLINIPSLNQFFAGHVSPSSSLLDMEMLKTTFNILHFTPSSKTSPDYTDIVSNMRTSDADDIANDGKSTSQTSREAQIGRLIYPSDVISAIASLIPFFRSFVTFNIDNYNESTIPYILHRGLQWIDYLATENFRQLHGTQLCGACRWVAHSLAVPYFQFFADIANEIKNDIIHTLSTPSTLNISYTTLAADRSFLDSLNRLILDVERKSISSFMNPPPSYSYFRGDKEEKICPFTRNIISSKKRTRDDNETPSTNHRTNTRPLPSSHAPQDSSTRTLNTKGFITTTLGSLPNFPRLTAFTPCRNFLISGKACRYTSCFYAHKIFPRDYSPEDCRKVCNYVHNTNGISFTPEAQSCLASQAARATNQPPSPPPPPPHNNPPPS